MEPEDKYEAKEEEWEIISLPDDETSSPITQPMATEGPNESRNSTEADQPLRRSTRIRTMPARYQDYVI